MTDKANTERSKIIQMMLDAGIDPNSAMARRVRAGDLMHKAMTECDLDASDRIVLCALYISSIGEDLNNEGRRTLAEFAITTMVEPWGMQAMAMSASDVLKAAAKAAQTDKPAN